MHNLRGDLFVISHNDEHIVYSPLRRAVFTANDQAKMFIEKYLSEQELAEEEKDTKVFDYISKSTALILPEYLSEKLNEVNILSIGYGDLNKNKKVSLN